MSSERWQQIHEFPDYSISTHGRVRNDVTGRILALTQNQNGVVNVGLTRDLVQYKRSVTKLVADSFLHHPDNQLFDTPINLDGDRRNNFITNLMWRPRWFAIAYHRQFKPDARPGFQTPIMDVGTQEIYQTAIDAAKIFGLLVEDITLAIINDTWVIPTYQKFVALEE